MELVINLFNNQLWDQSISSLLDHQLIHSITKGEKL